MGVGERSKQRACPSYIVILHSIQFLSWINSSPYWFKYKIRCWFRSLKKVGFLVSNFFSVKRRSHLKNILPDCWHKSGFHTLLLMILNFQVLIRNILCFILFSAGELIISLIQMYEANYPEILKICYIINGKLKK